MKTYLFVGFTLIVTLVAMAQEGIPELITDRADQTESSSPVPLKSLQIETGFMLEKDHNESRKVKNTTYNTTLLRYGLLSAFELRLGLAYSDKKITAKTNDSTYTDKGFSPLYRI